MFTYLAAKYFLFKIPPTWIFSDISLYNYKISYRMWIEAWRDLAIFKQLFKRKEMLEKKNICIKFENAMWYKVLK